MTTLLRATWAKLRRREAMPSWRALTNKPFWEQWPVVICTNSASRPSYEVWINGQSFATRPSLSEAKAVVEAKYGPQAWHRERMPLIEVDHYYFGPTTEFTDPITLNVVDNLVATAVRNSIYDAMQQAGAMARRLEDEGFEVGVHEGGYWVMMNASRRDTTLQAYWESADDLGAVFQGVKLISRGAVTAYETVDEALAAI